MPVSGNPQLNIRLEPELMKSVKKEAETQGMRPQEWVRRLIKETLGKVSTNVVLSTATTVSKDEFETVIAELREEIKEAKELESSA
jgi:4-hydroxy-3-methylbut-2-enyl diphosphate reductase IspH